jgi:hypothetical protein
MVARHGYPVEVHTVKTKDCYWLQMHRIPHGKKSPAYKVSVKLQKKFISSINILSFLKRLPGVGSEPGSSKFHLFSHFSPLYC